MSNSVQLFEEAMRKDDIDEVKSLLSDPNLRDHIRAYASSDNPLLMACEHGSHQVAEHIGSLWPELSGIRNQHGCTPMHIASGRGDVEMVQFLGELNPQSCLVQDNSSATPLHSAAISGNSGVIRQLISMCPESLGKLTSNRDTALHLAVKNSRSDTCQVLVDEIKNRKQEHLFNSKNEDGNTVLHLATFNKLIDIVKLLVLESSKGRKMIRVNSMNKQGKTALDVCKANCHDKGFDEIGLILQEAAAGGQIAHFSVQQSLHHSTSTTSDSWSIKQSIPETRNILLVVAGILITVFVTVIFDLPDLLLKNVNLTGKTVHWKDVLSGELPPVVYLLIFNSAGFMTTMMLIVVLGWLRWRTIILFVVICACIVYVISVNVIIPEFFVSFWKFRISSVGMMWSLVVALVCLGISILTTGKYISSLWPFNCLLWTKKMNCCSYSTVEDLSA